MPETGAPALILLLGSILEAVQQVLYLSCRLSSQQESMCVSGLESALLSNEVKKCFHVPTVAQLPKLKGETGLIRPEG